MLECGKVTDAVYRRSVQKILSGWPLQAGYGVHTDRDSCVFEKQGVPPVCAASAVSSGNTCGIAAGAVHQAVNRLAASGGEARGVMLQFTVPEGMEEKKLKALTASAAAACSWLQLPAGQSDALVVPGLQTPVVTATAMGDAAGLFTMEKAAADQDIIMAGYAGWRGAAELARKHRDQLEQHFNTVFLEQLLHDDQAAAELSCVAAVRAAVAAGVRNMYAIGEGGVFAAAWDMAAREKLGIRIHLKDIPIRQVTVEVCDYFNISPYQLLSTGALLLAVDHGQKVLTELAAAGIPAVIIGHLTGDNDRVILNEEEVRYLEPFRQDSLNAQS